MSPQPVPKWGSFDSCQEDRLRDLEKESKHVVAELTENRVQLQHLSGKLSDMSSMVSEKLDNTLSVMERHIEAQSLKFDKLSEVVETAKTDILHLKKVENARAKRINTIKKIVLAAILAAAGVIGTKAAEFVPKAGATPVDHIGPAVVQTIDAGSR